MLLQKLPTCKKTTTSLSEKTSEKLSQNIKCNTKETVNGADIKGVTSDPIQDTPDFEEVKIHQTESSDCVSSSISHKFTNLVTD